MQYVAEILTDPRFLVEHDFCELLIMFEKDFGELLFLVEQHFGELLILL